MITSVRLAEVLGTSEFNINQLAEAMGLSVNRNVQQNLWLQHGYMTILRNNWHLLPYEQLLTLLGWSAEKMAYILKEDDFCWNKLGRLKPKCPRIIYRSLTCTEQTRTRLLRDVVRQHFPVINREKFHPFNFSKNFQSDNRKLDNIELKANAPLRLVYSYFGVYGDPFENSFLDPYPDNLLASYANLGINGCWLQGVLYKLIPWHRAPEMATGWEKRLRNLRKLAVRAGKYGIGIYLYINEPRSIPRKLAHKFHNINGPDYGDYGIGVCTSLPEVRDYLRHAMTELFRQVPELAGVFTVTMSENPTNCYSFHHIEQCPRCHSRQPEEVISEVNRTIAEGVHTAKPSGRVIVWSWGWHENWAARAIDLLPPNVEFMCVSEAKLPTKVGGINGEIGDYSISKVGPSGFAKKLWSRAKNRGLKVVAKIQVNNSWECSAVPYLPVNHLIEEHLYKLASLEINDYVLSWTLGGYPSPNLELLDKTSEMIVKENFGAAAELISESYKIFSEAFRELPYDGTRNVYNGPVNYGPVNLLFASPTGYRATMLGMPYDDLEMWRANYPTDVYQSQFLILSNGWKKGLKLLKQARKKVPPEKIANWRELNDIATAVYCHFRSTYLQIKFTKLRVMKSHEHVVRKTIKILKEEIALAKILHGIILNDNRIGFEASNHYYYTPSSLCEKVLNCENLLTGYKEIGYNLVHSMNFDKYSQNYCKKKIRISI